MTPNLLTAMSALTETENKNNNIQITKQHLLCRFYLLRVDDRPYPLLKPFGYGQETEQLTFKLKQAGMLENSVDF